jgi:hypothetical protein
MRDRDGRRWSPLTSNGWPRPWLRGGATRLEGRREIRLTFLGGRGGGGSSTPAPVAASIRGERHAGSRVGRPSSSIVVGTWLAAYWTTVRQILCSARRRDFVGSARGRMDMARGLVPQSYGFSLFWFSWRFFFSASSLVRLVFYGFSFFKQFVFE